MNYVMDKHSGKGTEIEVWGTNKPWLKSAAQRKNADAGGLVIYTVRAAEMGETLPLDKFLGNIATRRVTGKMDN